MIRSAIIGGLSTSEFSLTMVLLSIECGDVSFQPTELERQQSILRRRGRAYKLIRNYVADAQENAKWLEDFTVSLGTMAATEKRLGNTQIYEHHTRAVKKLVDLQGGLKTIRKMDPAMALMLVNILIEIGVPDLHRLHGPSESVAHLQQKMRQFQAWNYWIRIHDTSSIAFVSSRIDSKSTAPRQSYTNHLRHWVRKFNDPILADYIKIPSGRMSGDEYRCYLAVLFIINTAFWAFRDSETISDIYLRDLSNSAKKSVTEDSVLRCFGTKSPTITLLIMMTHSAAGYEKPNQTTGAVFAVEELLDFVELMMRTTSQTRDIVLRALWSYLSCLDVCDIAYLSHATLDNVAAEIEDEWRQAK